MTNSQDEAEIARLRASAPDHKETMEIGRDWNSTWKNMWPQESDAPGFKKFMVELYQVCSPFHKPSSVIENLTCSHATNCMFVSCELSPLDLIYKKTFSKTKSTRRIIICVCSTTRKLRQIYCAKTVKLVLVPIRITVSPPLDSPA